MNAIDFINSMPINSDIQIDAVSITKEYVTLAFILVIDGRRVDSLASVTLLQGQSASLRTGKQILWK